MEHYIIAIDGPAASGKSSVAKGISEKLGIPYVNTGNMYRAVTWYMLQHQIVIDQKSEALIKTTLDQINLEYRLNGQRYELFLNGVICGSEIRSHEVSTKVSLIATFPFVREWLIKKQRQCASVFSLVMEGRDIGTVVFPKTPFKFFLTASAKVRAQRRLAQSNEMASQATLESVICEIEQRDEMDIQRQCSPLRKAEDAVLVDSSEMTLEQVVDYIVQMIKVKKNGTC